MNGQTGQVSLKDFLEKYPETSYFQVFPRLVLAEELPDYISFALEILRIAPAPIDSRQEDERYDTYWIEEPWIDNGKVKDPGYLELTATALNRLAVAMGIQWSYQRRIDNGADPLYCEYEACGILPNITGARPEIQTYGLNLHVRRRIREKQLQAYPPKGGKLPGVGWVSWKDAKPEQRQAIIETVVEDYVLQLQDSLVQRAATGARSRVIRALSGLPRKFRPATLEKKPFAVLKVIYAPRAKTPEERMHLHELMAGVYGRIYPTQQGRELGRPREIQALPPGDEIPIEPQAPEEAPGKGPQASAEGRQEARGLDPAQEVAQGGDRKPEPRNGAEGRPVDGPLEDPFVSQIRELHEELVELEGPKTAQAFLRGLVRHHKVGRIGEIQDDVGRREALAAYEARIEEGSQKNAGLPPPGDPQGPPSELSAPPIRTAGSPATTSPPSMWAGKRYQMVIELRYANLQKQQPKQLMDVINTYTQPNAERPGGYPHREDPAQVMDLLSGDNPGRDDLLEAAIRLVEWGLQNSMKARD